MNGKHAGVRDTEAETRAYDHAVTGDLGPLRGKRHKTGAIHVVRALRNAWNQSTERTHTGAPA